MKKLKEMLNRRYSVTEAIGIILTIVAVGVVIDLWQGHFSIFFIALSIFLSISGYRRLKRKNSFFSYVLITVGAGILLFSIITSFAFTLIFAVLIIYNAFHLFKTPSKKTDLPIKTHDNPHGIKSFVQVDPYYKNKLVGEYRNIQASHTIEDINVQTGFGDVILDLTDTIIPEGETIIIIRGLIGNINIKVPNDTGLLLNISLMCGKITLFYDSETALNTTQKYQSADYKNQSRKIKLMLSLLVGDIEVKK